MLKGFFPFSFFAIVSMALSACTAEGIYEGSRAYNKAIKSTPMEKSKDELPSYDQYEKERRGPPRSEANESRYRSGLCPAAAGRCQSGGDVLFRLVLFRLREARHGQQREGRAFRVGFGLPVGARFAGRKLPAGRWRCAWFYPEACAPRRQPE